jgi:hypothetical protein
LVEVVRSAGGEKCYGLRARVIWKEERRKERLSRKTPGGIKTIRCAVGNGSPGAASGDSSVAVSIQIGEPRLVCSLQICPTPNA